MLFERTAASSSATSSPAQEEDEEGELKGGTPIDVDCSERGGNGEASTSREPDPDVRPRARGGPASPPFEYRYLTEFQSHEPEFDYLKSLEIEEKINKVRWARRNVAGGEAACGSGPSSSSSCAAGSANGRLLLSTNDKTIKLWRVYDRRVVTLAGFNTARGALGGSGGGGVVGGLPLPTTAQRSGDRDRDLIGVVRMPPVAAGAGDGTGDDGEESEEASARAAEAAAARPPPPGTTPWSIAASARSSEPRAPRPPASAAANPSPSSSSPTCEAEDERIGNKIKAFGISSDSGGGGEAGSRRTKAAAAPVLRPPPPPPAAALLTLPRAVAARAVLSARCRRTFAGAHAYHVNSLSMCSDGETFLSADDLRVQLWHLDSPPPTGRGGGSTARSAEVGDDGEPAASTSSRSSSSSSSSPFYFSVSAGADASSSNSSSSSAPYVLVDMKPACMDDLTEVVTAAEFHPSDCALFCHASSKGTTRVCDMRSRALCDRPALALEPPGLAVGEGGGGGGGGGTGTPGNTGGGRSFFSEITASLSDARWCGRDGRRIVTRDYLNLTLWDLAMPSGPVAAYPVHDCLRPRLADLYENDCVFDKFGVAVSGDGACAASGTYSSLFRVVPGPGDEARGTGGGGGGGDGGAPWRLHPLAGSSSSSSMAPPPATTRQGAPGVLLEASRDPRRRRALAAAAAGSAASEGANAALAPPPGLGRFGLAPSSSSSNLTAAGAGAAVIRGGPDDDSAEAVASDLTAKMLHLAWHPGADVIAAAASNSLYLYYHG